MQVPLCTTLMHFIKSRSTASLGLGRIDRGEGQDTETGETVFGGAN